MEVYLFAMLRTSPYPSQLVQLTVDSLLTLSRTRKHSPTETALRPPVGRLAVHIFYHLLEQMPSQLRKRHACHSQRIP